MKASIGCLIGFVFVVSVSAEPLLEGRVRLDSGEPVADAQVRLFDLTDLRRGAIAHAMTDGTGYFALPLAALAGSVLPQGFTLGPNYPNPFNPSTIIPYQLVASSEVRLEVFNLLGQHIATLVDGERPAGFHTATWTATDGAGRAVAAGVYLYRMTVGEERQTGRMVLIDGQAGRPATGSGGSAAAVEAAGAAAAVYGLTVSGPGLVSLVDPAFRVAADQGSVDLVVETLDSIPRAKVAATGILGDVDNNAQVDLFDALLVALYSGDASLVLPHHGAIALGDVNADGQVDRSDAGLISAYSNDPSDPTLPAGLGKRVSSATASLSPDPSTVSFADDGIWHRFTVQASESVSVVVNPGATRPRLELTTRSGRDNYCPGGADDAVAREDSEAIYLAGCASGTATVELRRASDDTVLQTYTFTVSASPADLVVSASVSASSLPPGQSFTLSATVRNQGTAAAATTLHYYRSSNRTISWQDTQVGSDAVSALAASATSAESISLTAPSDVGTYYYGACVERKSGESAGNNCSTGVRVTVDASIPKKVVRVLYVAPEDRPFRPEYSEGVSKAILNVQSWYRDQLGGPTFQLYSTTPEWCQMSGDSDYYSHGHVWDKVLEGVQHCAPVAPAEAGNSDFVWVLYVDAEERCDEPYELGRGAWGLTMMPRWDLEGLVNPGEFFECGDGPFSTTLGRWRGGLGHELGHALALPHPPGCDVGLATCDSPALMSYGYASYPDTYLRIDEKELLIRSPFITGWETPANGSDATEGSLGVQGVVLDPSGAPMEGIRLSLVADTFWNWGETGQDGTFWIGVPEEASQLGRRVCPRWKSRQLSLAGVLRSWRADFTARRRDAGGGWGSRCGRDRGQAAVHARCVVRPGPDDERNRAGTGRTTRRRSLDLGLRGVVVYRAEWDL